MITLCFLTETLEGVCPLALSRAYVERGAYDNSGVIVRTHEEINKILFTLDLTVGAAEAAVKLGCDTVITHHPVIYRPISSLGDDKALLSAVTSGMNLISMHLNLDIATGGVDDCLAAGLGAVNPKVIEKICGENGYGREFTVKQQPLASFAEAVKKTFGTDKIVVYGGGNVCKVASFCGAGGGSAAEYAGDADLIVTSDIPHHLIKQITERGKNVMLLTHYAAENYGYKLFFGKMQKLLGGAECFFHEDPIFM